MFLNDKKTNLIQTEQFIVSSNPKVIAVLVVNAQRFQTAVFVKCVVGDDGDGKEPLLSKRAAFIKKI